MNLDMSPFNQYEMKLSDEVKKNISCSVVQTFPYSQRCKFVEMADNCQGRMFYVNYVKLLYCNINPQSDFTAALSMVLLMSLCFILFLILASSIEKIFCPALKVFAILMGMNEHLAGVTLVAFGGCSPDVLTTVFSKNEVRGLIAEVVGNSFYVCTFIGGLIIILAPFEMQAYNSFRDICFLLFSLLYIDFAIDSHSCVSLVESCVILIIYGFYIIVLIADQVMLKRNLRRSELNKLEKLREDAAFELVGNTGGRLSRASTIARPSLLPGYGTKSGSAGRGGQAAIISNTRKSQYIQTQDKNQDLFVQFYHSVNPIDVSEFLVAGHFRKAIQVIQAPIHFVLMLFIPVVDYEIPRHGWSKLLNCLQIFTAPLMFVFCFIEHPGYFGIPIWAFTIILSIPLVILVFQTSRTDIPPRYHVVFAILACFGCIAVIFVCAVEVMHILYVIGLATNASPALLGATLLAWGMSIGDLISNIMLALHGYPRMGYAACFGSPMFNNVFIVGGHYLHKNLNSEEDCVPTPGGDLDENCMIFMLLSLVATIMWMLLTNCHARRSVGIYMILIYFAFFLYTSFGEIAVLHSFAGDANYFNIL